MSSSNKQVQRCTGCKTNLPSKEFLSCVACKSKYDLLCANLTSKRFNNMDSEVRKSWKCPECQSKQPKTDNSNTPIRSTITASEETLRRNDTEESSYITHRNKTFKSQSIMTPPEEINENDRNSIENIGLLWSELRAIRLELKQFISSFSELKATLEGYTQRIEELEVKFQSLEEKVDSQNTSGPIHDLETTISNLKQKLSDQDQEMLANDIEIAGIPEYRNEGIVHVVLSAAKKIGIDIDERDVVSAERVGPLRFQSEDGSAPRPRPIAVRFTRRAVKNAFVQGARIRRGATTEGMGLPGETKSFYVNERLTKLNRQLFYKAREIASKLKWRYVWTRDGKVYVRQATGKGRSRISTEGDLAKVFGADSVRSMSCNTK